MCEDMQLPYVRVINVANADEYRRVLQYYEQDEGYVFSTCDDLRRLHYGMLGHSASDQPLLWVRVPIVLLVEDDGVELKADEFYTEAVERYLGEPVDEEFLPLTEYQQAFVEHRARGHFLIQAGDPLCHRLAFVCVNCHTAFRADWDECISLGLALDGSLRKSVAATGLSR